MAETSERRVKLVRTGRGQVVRLPKEFQFAGDEVRIRRTGETVVLEPVVVDTREGKPDWSWLDRIQGTFDDSFFNAIEELRREGHQERPELDKFFP